MKKFSIQFSDLSLKEQEFLKLWGQKVLTVSPSVLRMLIADHIGIKKTGEVRALEQEVWRKIDPENLLKIGDRNILVQLWAGGKDIEFINPQELRLPQASRKRIGAFLQKFHNPSSEQIARYVAERIERITFALFDLVTVWESIPSSTREELVASFKRLHEKLQK